MSNDVVYLDVENALKRVGGNENLFKKLLKVFIHENIYESLYESIEKGAVEEISGLAHTLKGVSANLSLNSLRDIATAIEIDAKAGNDCKASLPELKASFEKTSELVKEYIG